MSPPPRSVLPATESGHRSLPDAADASGRSGSGALATEAGIEDDDHDAAPDRRRADPGARAKAPPSRQGRQGGRHAAPAGTRASILLKHVSDPTRLQVILILAEGEQHVGALCAQLSQSQPAVSHHLALLRHGGIIAPRRQGKNNFYSLTDTGTDLSVVVKGLMS